MKKRHLLLVVLIPFFFAAKLMSQTIITLTFTANTDTMHQPLDSVVVENLTRGGDTVLHYPDTVLLLDHGTGVFNPYRNTKEGMILYPSFPNPFTGFTTTRLFLPDDDVITIRVFDLLGRQQAVHHQSLPAGEHIYNLYSGSEKYYLLVVETSHDRRVQKLISMGGEGAFRIDYSGSYQQYSGFRKSKTGFAWAPGDQLLFTGYATHAGSVILCDTLTDDPLVSSLYTFQFLLLPSQPSPIFGDTIPCKNDTGLIYSVIPEIGVTYAWTVPAGWSIIAGQGTHEITVTAGTTSGIIQVIPSNNYGQGLAQTLSVATQVCYPPGYVHCDPANPTAVVEVINPITGITWMDRNLGASQAATSSTDSLAYGDLYQWGRFADGHQCRTASITTYLSSTDQPGHANFIITEWNSPNDWRSPQNNNLWQGVNGVNNPCPIGYRLPTSAELMDERSSWSSNNAAGAFASPLRLTMSGNRSRIHGLISFLGLSGVYWSSSTLGTGSTCITFNSTNSTGASSDRAGGLSVRCIKDVR